MQNEIKTILVMAGGTGGHIFPALAVAEVLKHKGARIEWLGTRNGLESRLVPDQNYPIHYIDIGGLRGKGIKTLLLLPFRLLKAMIQTFKVYQQTKPDVVLGMGGFVTGPGGIVGWLTGRPLVLHEQNAIAGLTNKILFRFARKVFAAFPGAFAADNKLSVVGNPVRKSITEIPAPNERNHQETSHLHLLIIGGSLGATALNEIVPAAISLMLNCEHHFEKIVVRHQCGEKHLDATEKNYELLNNKEPLIKINIMSFIDNMAENYAWADLIICRSGALTVSEIAAAGVASILVPFPYAVDDHQTANARYLAEADAAILIQQNELNSEKLASILSNLEKNILQAMAFNARKLSISNAAEVVAEECLKLAG
jgi:UDP-N-acetylglucosamine--N-acetylmuramyl-(pentapeptide) pyrophosphoryl-undecaprenol N-acetylglucosamine transferase